MGRARAFMTLVPLCLSLVACGGSSSGGSTSSSSKVYTIRMALTYGPSDYESVAAQTFKTVVEQESNHRLQVQFFYTGQLGTNQEMGDQVVAGSIQMSVMNNNLISNYYPDEQVTLFPFMFTSESQALSIMDGPIGQSINSELLKQVGLRTLCVGDSGFSEFYDKLRPIQTLQDWKGLKIVSAPSASFVAAITALGATPEPTVAITQAYTAIQQGVVDGGDQPVGLILSQKLYEVAPHISLVDDFFGVVNCYINNNFYQSLPKDLQQDLIDAGKAMQPKMRSLGPQTIQAQETQMMAAGAHFNTPSADSIAAMRNAVKPVYDRAGSLIGAQGAAWLQQILAAEKTS